MARCVGGVSWESNINTCVQARSHGINAHAAERFASCPRQQCVFCPPAAVRCGLCTCSFAAVACVSSCPHEPTTPPHKKLTQACTVYVTTHREKRRIASAAYMICYYYKCYARGGPVHTHVKLAFDLVNTEHNKAARPVSSDVGIKEYN